MIVDIELDQLDRALCRAHRLFQDRRELTAGTAPRRPEIDQHRHLARGLDHVAHEVLGGGVLDEVGLGAAGAAVLENRGILRSCSSALQPCKMGRSKPFGNRPKAAIGRGEGCGGIAASLDKADEVLRRHSRGRGVHEGMAVYLGKVEQCRVDHDDHVRRRRIDQRHRRN